MLQFDEKLSHDNHSDEISLKDLKANLTETLRRSGVLNSVKAQIRREFIQGLTGGKASSLKEITAATGPSDAAAPGPGHTTLNDRITYSCVYNLLKDRQLHQTISVFIAECGLEPRFSILSEDDLSKVIKFAPITTAYRTGKPSTSSSSIGKNDTSPHMAVVDQRRSTVLDLLIYFCLITGDNRGDASCQTDFSGPGIRETLDDSISTIRHNYRLHRDEEMLKPSKTIEERMIAFQRDCEKRMQHDLAIQVAQIREHEVRKVRLEERQAARADSEARRKEIDFEYSRRLQAHIDRETASAQRLSELEHNAQRSLYEARQLMQREIDDWRSRESAAVRKQQLEAEGVRMVELRLKEAQVMLEGRERSIGQRERELEEKMKSSREDARKESLAAVQAELDVLSKERSSLILERKRFDTERANQAALSDQVSSLQSQLRAALDELAQRGECIDAMERTQKRMRRLQDEEEERVKKMITQVDPSFASYSRLDQVVALIRQNASLEVKLASFKDVGSIQQRCLETEEENKSLKVDLHELQSKLESERLSSQAERERLVRSCSSDRARLASCTHQLEELQRLVADKSRAVDSLQRQLDGQRSKSSTRGGGGGDSEKALASISSASSRQAQDLLHRHRTPETLDRRNDHRHQQVHSQLYPPSLTSNPFQHLEYLYSPFNPSAVHLLQHNTSHYAPTIAQPWQQQPYPYLSQQPPYSYGNQPMQPTYTTNQPSQQPPPYATHQPSQQPPSYATHQPSQQPPPYTTHQPSQQPPPYTTNQPSQQPPPYATHQPSQQPPPYSTNQPSQQPPPYSTNQPSQQPPPDANNQPSQQPPPGATNQPSQQSPPYTTNEPSQQPPPDATNQPSQQPPQEASAKSVPSSYDDQPASIAQEIIHTQSAPHGAQQTSFSVVGSDPHDAVLVPSVLADTTPPTVLTTGLGDNDHADGSTAVGGRASATADLEETIGCSPSSVSAEQGTLQNTLPPPHKDLSVDEVVQQYRCSDVSELRPLSEASSTRPSFMFITSLDSLNGERYDAVQDGIPDIGKGDGDAEEDKYLRQDDASDAALTTSRVNAEADAISSEVQAATSSRYRDESSSPVEEDDSESFDEIRGLLGSSFFKSVDAVAAKKVEVKEEKEDFVPDFASIRKNTLARRKNSMLSQSLPSQIGSASADVSRQSFNSATAFSSSVDTTSSSSAPDKEKVPPAKLLFQSLRDESDSSDSHADFEVADQSDDVADPWG